MFAVDVCRLPTTGGSAFVLVAGAFLLVLGVIVARWVRQSSGRLSIVVAPLVLLGGLAFSPSVIDPCVSTHTTTTTVPSVTTTTAPSATTTVPSATTTVPATSLDTALTPTFDTPTATADGFTVQITNYDANFSWAGTATASGTISIDNNGLLTVTGVAAGTSSTATITTTRTGYTSGTATASETTLDTALTPTFDTPTATADGFTVLITNYAANFSWAGTATASGTISIDNNGLLTVAGVAAGANSTATITTTRTGYTSGTATVSESTLTANQQVVMSMVSVGNPGNAADTTSYGALSYSFQIGKYDVTGSQYAAFLNAVAKTDSYGLYNANMGTDTQVGQISRSGSSGSYIYAVMNDTGNRPITYVSWYDGARFVNWMSNGQPSGAQTSTTTENGTYNVNGATSGNAVAKNTTNLNTGLAPSYWIPLENEWYKAAYYSPNYGGTGVGGFYDYATKSDAAPGTTIGSTANKANYINAFSRATDVGSFSGSGSFYGTFDQTGNVWQWSDLDGAPGSSRSLRGGGWGGTSIDVSSSSRADYSPDFENNTLGFRLAGPVTTTLTPTFGTATATTNGFTVQITNYDSSYTWAGTATFSGTVTISGTGLVTVAGVQAAKSSIATITTNKSNTVGGTATVAIQVGSFGPGGGRIFIIPSTTGNTAGKFYEVGPKVKRSWATVANQSKSVVGAGGTAIGTGKQNTLDIVNQTGNVAATSAAVYCSDLDFGGKQDWYLPSKDELTQISQNKVALKLTNLTDGYWSSSESTSSTGMKAWRIYLNGGQWDEPYKSGSNYSQCVRTV